MHLFEHPPLLDVAAAVAAAGSVALHVGVAAAVGGWSAKRAFAERVAATGMTSAGTAALVAVTAAACVA